VFFEEPARRSLPRPSPAWVLLTVLLIAGGAALALLLLRDPAPEPLGTLARARAEQLLTRQLEREGRAGVGSVRCAGPIGTARLTRCQLLYSDGDTQLMLVRRRDRGPLEIVVPYPAQRRPGG
jgi:hypothetical protein